MKKIIAVMIIIVLLGSNALGNEPSKISAKSIVLMDGASGRLLYEKNGFEKASMASTTKIMTAILTIENCNLDDEVTVTPNASGVEGSSLWLEIGERLTVRQLLLGLMLKSGNDAAVALAEHTAGSVDSFVMLMNAKAKEIGMFNTSFETPNGLDSDKHFSTAYDMALLGRYAMKNETFREIVGTKNASIPWSDKDWERSLKNHNKLLWNLEGCTGIKTGYTKKSGRCLVSSVMRDGRELICASLNAPDDWNDHTNLYDYGFSEYETAVLIKKNQKWDTCSAGEEVLELVCGEDFVTSLKGYETGKVEYQTEINEVKLPVEKGQVMGRIYIFSEGEFLGGVDLIAAAEVKKPPELKDYIRIIAKELI